MMLDFVSMLISLELQAQLIATVYSFPQPCAPVGQAAAVLT